MLKLRDTIAEDMRVQKDKKIKQKFIDFMERSNAKTVLLYASFGSEVDTWRIFHFCRENSIKTAFPKVIGNELELYWIDFKEQLSPGYKSIFEPKEGRKAFIEEIEIIAVPGIVFDFNCFRIGYGGGFYDRLLSKRKGLAIGLAYEEQIVNEIPIDSFDQKVDLIITDERIISCV